MPVEVPGNAIAALCDHAARLHESRKAGTKLASLAADLLVAWFDVCAHAGLDRVLAELAQAFPPLEAQERTALSSHPGLVAAVVAQLESIDLDGGGPRAAKPRQLAGSVVTALGLAVVEPPDRAIALDDAVRVELARALAAALEVELAPATMREAIIAAARAACEAHHHAAFDRLAAQLDATGMNVVKQPKVPIDALHAAQRALYDARNAVIGRAAGVALDQAQAVLARVAPDAAARLDQPISLRATPREVAIVRARDARVPKTPARVAQSLLEALTALVPIAWRAPVVVALPYAASKTFAVGDVIEHPKFGRGKVTACAMKRIDVEFADGMHTLAHVPPAR